MSQQVKVGVVGLGFMAATHIKAYAKVAETRLAALCSPNGRRLDGDFSDVAGNVGGNDPVKVDMSTVRAYRDYADLLADPEIDLIDICSPTASHAEMTIAALEAGKHALCEKPMTRTSEEARRVVAAAKKAKTFLMPAMCLRFWPEWIWIKEAIADGRFGKVLGANFRRVAEPPGWGQHNFLDGAKSGGALLDLHVHDVDFVQFCFGRPSAVSSAGYTKISGAIDHVVTRYEFPNGPMVHTEGCWAMTPGFGFNMSYLVNFERATVDYDLGRGENPLRVCAVGQPVEFPKPGGDDGYAGEVRHIAQAILQGSPPTVVTPEEGLSAVEICEAEERSIRTGLPQSVA